MDDTMETSKILQSVIDRPDEYTNEWWRLLFQRHNNRIAALEDDANELKRLLKLAVETMNAMTLNRRKDAAEMGSIRSDNEHNNAAMETLSRDVAALSKRMDAASEYMRAMTAKKEPSHAKTT
jgi:uncharacterized protein YukE